MHIPISVMSSHPWCIHEVDPMHMHAIGAPRNVTKVKFHKTYLVKLEPVREPEVQSDGTGGDVGATRESRAQSLRLCRLRQVPEHYKPPTFKVINYVCICIVALGGRSCLEPLLHYIIPYPDI
jgi:hypothetical protein